MVHLEQQHNYTQATANQKENIKKWVHVVYAERTIFSEKNSEPFIMYIHSSRFSFELNNRTRPGWSLAMFIRNPTIIDAIFRRYSQQFSPLFIIDSLVYLVIQWRLDFFLNLK
jgi:hypothetical protein